MEKILKFKIKSKRKAFPIFFPLLSFFFGFVEFFSSFVVLHHGQLFYISYSIFVYGFYSLFMSRAIKCLMSHTTLRLVGLCQSAKLASSSHLLLPICMPRWDNNHQTVEQYYFLLLICFQTLMSFFFVFAFANIC